MLHDLVGICQTGLGVTILGIIFIHISSILIGVEHLRDSGRLGHRVTSVVVHGHLAFLSSLGSHEYDTVGCACSVYGGRRILQDRDALDVFRIQTGKTSVGDTVDDNQRGSVSECTLASDQDVGVIRSRLAGTVVGNDTGGLASESVGHVRCGDLLEVITVDCGDGTGQSRFLLHSVTYHDHLIDEFDIFRESDIDDSPEADRHLDRSVSYRRNRKNRITGNIDAVPSVKVGDNTVRRTCNDACAYDRLALGIDYFSFHSDVGRLLN